MENKRALLREEPQGFFGIEGGNLSPSGWAEAVAELNTVRLLSKNKKSRFKNEKLWIKNDTFCIQNDEFLQMKDVNLPTDKLRVLLRAKDVVLRTFTAEHPPRVRPDGKTKSKTLAGDDFQPIFIYMVCQCDVSELTPTCQLLWDLCDPKVRKSCENHAKIMRKS